MADVVFNIRLELEDATRFLTGLEREQVPFATALALTRTFKRIEAAEREEIGRVFDRPTPYTLNSLYTKTASKSDLTAEVRVKDASDKTIQTIKWLSPEIYGGDRGLKRSEQRLRAAGILPAGLFMVPAQGLKLNAYGNVTPGQMQKILAGLKANFDPTSNETAKSRKRKGKAASQYFAITEQRLGSRLKPGIYERKAFGFGSAIRAVFMFVRPPHYRKRWNFHEIAARTYQANFNREFGESMRLAIDTAYSKAGLFERAGLGTR